MLTHKLNTLWDSTLVEQIVSAHHLGEKRKEIYENEMNQVFQLLHIITCMLLYLFVKLFPILYC